MNGAALAGAPRVPRTEPVGACPVCGSTAATPLFAIPDRSCGVPGSFAYRRCRTCRSAYQDPAVVAEDLPLCYPSAYYTHGDPGAATTAVCPAAAAPTPSAPAGFKAALRAATRAAVRGAPAAGALGWLGRALATAPAVRVRAFGNDLPDALLPRSPEPRRALDIGCGSGDLMASLARAGWAPEGVDFDPAAARLARQRTGLRVQVGDFMTLPLEAGAFALIVMSHVLEHLHRPHAALARVRDLLAPRGRAVFIYPNPGAWGARVYGRDWFAWEAPRHLVLPAPPAFARLARASGFTVRRARSRFASMVGVTGWLAASRGYHEGRSHADAPPPNARDRALARAERALVGVGFDVGEDVLAVLELA